MIERYLCVFLFGAVVGVWAGITRAVHDIKKHPEKWEQFGIFQRKTGAYIRGWTQGWRDGCRATIKEFEDVVEEEKLAKLLAEQKE